MKYAKINTEGQIELAGNQIKIDDSTITFPTSQEYIQAGYKNLVKTQSENKKWYNPISKYRETTTQIIQEWEYEKQPAPDYATLVEARITTPIETDDVMKGGYTLGAEIALNRNPDDHPDKIAYLQWVEDSKEWAQEQINEWKNA
jgi:predicted methyltransferase